MNLVLVVVDSLRASHLGCYGYGKDTSPHLDALARESLVLDNLIAPAIPTMPSFTTLLTGLHPYKHGIVAHGGEARLAPEVLTLAQVAKNSGAVTVGIDNLAIQGSGRGSWFSRGFDYYSGYLYQPFSTQSAQLVERAQTFLEEFEARKFFLFMHLWDPHSPYGPPKEYAEKHYHPDGRGREKLAAIEALAPDYYEAFLDDFKLRQRDDFDWIMAQYDGEISYVDSQIERILSTLKAQNHWEDTVVAVLADHGECFGEGDFWFDHHSLYDATLKLAGLFHVPGANPGRCNTLLSQEDIFPTLCELCGYDTPQDVTGHSFAPLFRGRSVPGHTEIFAVESSRQASLAIRTPQWKLILPVTTGANGEILPDFYGQPRNPASQLFDLVNDPAESTDVSIQHPAILAELQAKLRTWHQDAVAARHGDDPVKNGLSLGYDEFMAKVCKRAVKK